MPEARKAARMSTALTCLTSHCPSPQSNVRGPSAAMHLCGCEVGMLHGLLPTPPGVALGIGLGTYAGRVHLTVTCNNGLLDAQELLGLMVDEHATYCAAVAPK